MSRPRVRPEFEQPFAGEPRAFFAALGRALADRGAPCQGQAFGEGAILRVRSDDPHLWSPALHLYAEDGAGGGRVLHGRFSPSSPVWTAFVALYLLLLIGALAAGCYGWVQLTLDETPWAFAGIPLALALAGFTYGAAFIGQGLGADDMHTLRAFVERVADDVERGAAARCAVRPERVGDGDAVAAVHRAAFGGAAEAELVGQLRAAGKAAVSLVAEVDGELVGHVLFSPVAIDGLAADRTALGLAPLGVLPAHQGRGVGSALTRAGLAACRGAGAHAVVVLGHAHYYPRFGFVPAARFGLGCEYDVPSEHFMAMELVAGALGGVTGTVRYAAEFARFA